MKKLFVLAFAMTMTMAVSAQITWKPKAGVGYALAWGSDTNGDVKSFFIAKAGMGIEKRLNVNWSLMPSFEIAWKRFMIDVGSGGTGNIECLYLHIPITAAYRIYLSNDWNTTLKGGPYVAYAVYEQHDKYYKSYPRQKILEDIRKIDVGIDVGVDFELHRFVFGVEADMGFLSIAGSDIDIKNIAFYTTVGYKF